MAIATPTVPGSSQTLAGGELSLSVSGVFRSAKPRYILCLTNRKIFLLFGPVLHVELPPCSTTYDGYHQDQVFSAQLGFASTLILARLLTPEDFGIVAMAMVVAGLTSVLFEFGVTTVLIQDPQPTDRDYNTAWTLRFLQGAGPAAGGPARLMQCAASFEQKKRFVDICRDLQLKRATGFIEPDRASNSARRRRLQTIQVSLVGMPDRSQVDKSGSGSSKLDEWASERFDVRTKPAIDATQQQFANLTTTNLTVIDEEAEASATHRVLIASIGQDIIVFDGDTSWRSSPVW